MQSFQKTVDYFKFRTMQWLPWQLDGNYQAQEFMGYLQYC